MKRRPTLFAIFLHEDPDGKVTVTGDYLGLGINAFDLGIDMMAHLDLISREVPNMLTVRPVMISEYIH